MHPPSDDSSYRHIYPFRGYTPNNSDILCGRGKANAKHPGNMIFMRIIRSSLTDYSNAESRIHKSVVVTSVVSNIVDAGMRFLKVDTNNFQYKELSSEGAHDKVGHAIRDLLKQEKNKKDTDKADITARSGKFKSRRPSAIKPVTVPDMVDKSTNDNKNAMRKRPLVHFPPHIMHPQQQVYQHHPVATRKNAMLGLSEYDVAFDEISEPSSTGDLQLVLSALSENIICSSSSGAMGVEHDLLAIVPDFEHIFSMDVLDGRGVSNDGIHKNARQGNIGTGGEVVLPLESKVDSKRFSDVLGADILL